MRPKVTQHRQNSLPRSEHQKKTTRSGAGKIGTEPNRPHHGLPVGPITTLSGWRTAVRPGVARPCAPGAANFRCFRATLRFSAVFALFCPYKTNVSGLIQYPIHPISFSFHLRFWLTNFFSFSSLFSTLVYIL